MKLLPTVRRQIGSGRCGLLLVIFQFLLHIEIGWTLSKVVIPAVYKEWVQNSPEWVTSTEIQTRHNFTVFLYQKLDPSKPNYLAINRGSEGGVYLRYIVDHYETLPDVMVFVHAHPHDHQKNWLDYVGCIAPTANYININFTNLCRNTHYWKHVEVWVEQCFRDVLKIVWGLNHGTPENITAFHNLVPSSRPIAVCLSCCNQFIVSRDAIRRLPLTVWRQLLLVLGEQPACRLEEPDYENLFVYRNQPTEANKPGPEPADLPQYNERKGEGFV